MEGFVQAQVQQGVIQFARHCQRPERGAGVVDAAEDRPAGSVGPWMVIHCGARRHDPARPGRCGNSQSNPAQLYDRAAVRVMPCGAVTIGPFAARVSARSCTLGFPGRGRNDFIHQPPFNGPCAAYAFFRRAEDVGTITANPTLVGQPRQPAGPRKHREQWKFR